MAVTLHSLPLMQRRILFAALVCAGFVANERRAAAQDEPRAVTDPWRGWSLSVQGQTGLMTPLGLYGGQFELSPSRWFSIQAGVGSSRTIISCSARNGMQVAVGPRFRVPVIAGFAVSTGLTYSWGEYGTEDGCPFEQGEIHQWDSARWLNWDVALEYRWQIGITSTLFAGWGDMLNGGDYVCSGWSCGGRTIPNPRDSTAGFLGATFGFWVHLGDG